MGGMARQKAQNPFGASGMAPQLFSNPSKLIRLSAINEGMDSLIELDQDDDDRHPYLKAGALGVGAAGVGATGLYGAGLLQRTKLGLGGAWNLARKDIGNIGQGGFSKIGSTISKGYGATLKPAVGTLGGAAKDIWSRLGKLGSRLVRASSKAPEIRFDEHILEPFSEGAAPKSKIAQEQFPAGLSPAAALQLPFPVLMRYMNRRNILQQAFSKREKLIQLNSRVNDLIKI